MADAPEIKVKLTAEDTGVSAAIKELTSQLKTLKKQQDETAGSALSLKNAFAGIIAIGGTLELGRIAKDAFDSAVAIGKMADKTGITTQTLSVFHHVAEELGVSVEGVDKGLSKAARSITEFEQGSAKATKSFKLLGIAQKDFAGLNSDQKIALVTTRLGQMAASFQKNTAAAQIFGQRSGTDIINVANAIAGEGFDKITASVSKLGLLLNQETTDAFRSAKASMQELEDVGKGMATQFEAGLLPAISDVGEALVDSLTQGGVGFEGLGKYAGNAVRGIALIFLGLGQTIGVVAASIADVFEAVFKEIANSENTLLNATDQAAHGHLLAAIGEFKAGAKNSTAIVSDEVDRQKAIYKSLGESFKADYANLFPSDAEEAKRKKERIARLRPEKQTEAPDVVAAGAPSDAAARAALSLLEKQLQDELEIHRAYAKQSEQIDKEFLDAGELSLHEYFDRRRAAILTDTEEEVALLQRGVEAAKGAAAKAAAAKAKADTPKDADKQEAARLTALQKVDELQTKISVLQIGSGTKIQALNDEQFKAQKDNLQKVLEFDKLIATTKGSALDAAKAEIAIEKAKQAIILANAGYSKAEIEQRLANFERIKTAEATFVDQQKSGQTVLKQLSDQRADIEDRVKTGQLFQVQGEEQIRALEQARLPVLQQIANEMLKQAQATSGPQREANIAQAEDFQKQVNQVTVQSNQVGQQIATIKQGLQSSLTGGFASFFQNMVAGTQSVANAFRGLAASVLQSLSQIAAQMLAQIIITKLLKSALGGFSGGGLVGGGAPGHAEGGLIRGPGGPKSDSIPARVSPGEYIVKADAVSAFGVQNLEAINRGLKVPSFERLALPKFAEGGLVGNIGGGGGESNINLGIGLDEGLILKHLSSKAAGNIVLQHLTNNPKAAQKALSRSD
jgi:hypothetical protein